MYDVVSVGILVADCLAKPIRKMPDRGKLELVDKISLHTGGNAATCAINVAKLGLRSAILGKIGGDGFGQFMDSSLKAAEDRPGCDDVGESRAGRRGRRALVPAFDGCQRRAR